MCRQMKCKTFTWSLENRSFCPTYPDPAMSNIWDRLSFCGPTLWRSCSRKEDGRGENTMMLRPSVCASSVPRPHSRAASLPSTSPMTPFADTGTGGACVRAHALTDYSDGGRCRTHTQGGNGRTRQILSTVSLHFYNMSAHKHGRIQRNES